MPGSSRWRRRFCAQKAAQRRHSRAQLSGAGNPGRGGFVGDSLGLSQQAAKTSADVIVFCGVHFMAETAKILNPNKIVVLPDKDAGCSLEESCPADKLAELQATNPNFWTIAYINCSAAVKALCDVICTSGNAVKIVQAAPKDKDMLFVPDENLGQWVMEQTGRPMTLWKGNCYAHVEFRREQVLRLRARNFRMPKSWSIRKACARCATWPTRFARRRR
jgi:quinolinate synthetase A subunit